VYNRNCDSVDLKRVGCCCKSLGCTTINIALNNAIITDGNDQSRWQPVVAVPME